MFRGQELTRPKNRSILFTVIVAIAVVLGSSMSPVLGYLSGITGLLAIIFASILDSFWPRGNKPENSVVFALFWGVMLGGVLPMIVRVFLEGGLEAVYQMLVA